MSHDLFANLEAPRANPHLMPIEELVATLTRYNDAYRRGAPEISDSEYEGAWLPALKARAPDHPFLAVPEPEAAAIEITGARVPLPAPMLSTEKAYTITEVNAWLTRIRAAAEQIGLDPSEVEIDVRPKLDGIAAHDTGTLVCTRGRGGFGTDISRWFSGATPIQTSGGRGRGAGEIVIDRRYFDEILSPTYDLDHPRNYVAGLVASQSTRDYHQQALADRKVILVSYDDLPTRTRRITDLADHWERDLEELQSDSPYLCDGAVAQVRSAALREQMGSGTRHHRWQIALKRNDSFAETEITSIRMTTGRTGRITPTMEIVPVELYGVTISWASAHTVQHLYDLKLGPGAKVVVTRAGGVVPALERVITPSASIGADLDHCPSCAHPTERDGPYLVCPNLSGCPAQTSRALGHFFKTLAVANGFGDSVTDALAAAGIRRPVDVYGLTLKGFTDAGISTGIASNLIDELARSRSEPISDAILLGALGIRYLGRGSSRRLLEMYPIATLGGVTAAQITDIDGFGDITGPAIAASLEQRWPELEQLLALGFNLIPTPNRTARSTTQGLLAGKGVVFTGTMTSGQRRDMEQQARTLGANVQGSVSKRTHLLVCGQNVGATKTAAAAALGVTVMSEADYLAIINQS